MAEFECPLFTALDDATATSGGTYVVTQSRCPYAKPVDQQVGGLICGLKIGDNPSLPQRPQTTPFEGVIFGPADLPALAEKVRSTQQSKLQTECCKRGGPRK